MFSERIRFANPNSPDMFVDHWGMPEEWDSDTASDLSEDTRVDSVEWRWLDGTLFAEFRQGFIIHWEPFGTMIVPDDDTRFV